MRFYKRNATLNFEWAFVERNQRSSRAPCGELTANQAAFDRSTHLSLLEYGYDPIGKILSVLGAPTAGQYLMSMCDLQGMQAIVALQLAVKIRHLEDVQIAAYVRQAYPPYGNPYRGTPFVWNAADRTLTFQPIAERDRKYLPWPI